MKVKHLFFTITMLLGLLFSQESSGLNLHGNSFTLRVNIPEDSKLSLQQNSMITEGGLVSNLKLRLRRNGIPYVNRMEDAHAILDVSINSIDIRYDDGEKADAIAFSFRLELNTWLLNQKGEDVWGSVYILSNLGYSPEEELKEWMIESLYEAIDQFSIDFIEENNL
tara:strand:+ start:247 stop:747 length:501 start_codon:yes stop_codon:yes gene_type:complete